MPAIQMTGKMFEERVRQGAGTALMEFGAPWCGYCRRLEPALDQVAEERSSLLVGKLDVDEEPELARRYQADAIPLLVYFRDGQPVDRLTGPDSKARIDQFLKKQEGTGRQ